MATPKLPPRLRKRLKIPEALPVSSLGIFIKVAVVTGTKNKPSPKP